MDGYGQGIGMGMETAMSGVGYISPTERCFVRRVYQVVWGGWRDGGRKEGMN
jgi:hypothetical protein